MTAVIVAILVGYANYNISVESSPSGHVNNCGKSVIIRNGKLLCEKVREFWIFPEPRLNNNPDQDSLYVCL